MNLETEIARDLLDIKAVQIKTDSYFTWTSGIKSPIYCDNRLTMSYPAIRKKIIQAFVKEIEERDVKPDVIAGCATAGIPHAAWLADALDLPMVYVRSTPKGHGKGNQIEGHIEKGQKVLVIEDLISTGGSSINVAKVLAANEVDVLGIAAIFSYGLAKAKKRFEDNALPFYTISNFDQLIEVLLQDKSITKEESILLLKWRDNLN